jgi:hypothetical protein
VAGTRDFNGDGKADILWRGPTGEVAIWDIDDSQSRLARPIEGVQQHFDARWINQQLAWVAARAGSQHRREIVPPTLGDRALFAAT